MDVGEKENPPINPYTVLLHKTKYRTSKVKLSVADNLKRCFLEYDGMVLSFDATWNDNRYQIIYFLVDNTMAIREIHEPNDGKDPVAMLLKRMRVPKDWKNLPFSHPSIFMEYGDSEIMEYYTPQDFKVRLLHSLRYLEYYFHFAVIAALYYI